MTRAQAAYLRWSSLVRTNGEYLRFFSERQMLDYLFWYDDFQLYGPSFPKMNYPEFVK